MAHTSFGLELRLCQVWFLCWRGFHVFKARSWPFVNIHLCGFCYWNWACLATSFIIFVGGPHWLHLFAHIWVVCKYLSHHASCLLSNHVSLALPPVGCYLCCCMKYLMHHCHVSACSTICMYSQSFLSAMDNMESSSCCLRQWISIVDSSWWYYCNF